METQTQVLKLAENGIKAVIILAFHMFRKLPGDTDDIKETQVEILELKTTVSEIEIIFQWNY